MMFHGMRSSAGEQDLKNFELSMQVFLIYEHRHRQDRMDWPARQAVVDAGMSGCTGDRAGIKDVGKH